MKPKSKEHHDGPHAHPLAPRQTDSQVTQATSKGPAKEVALPESAKRPNSSALSDVGAALAR